MYTYLLQLQFGTFYYTSCFSLGGFTCTPFQFTFFSFHFTFFHNSRTFLCCFIVTTTIGMTFVTSLTTCFFPFLFFFGCFFIQSRSILSNSTITDPITITITNTVVFVLLEPISSGTSFFTSLKAGITSTISIIDTVVIVVLLDTTSSFFKSLTTFIFKFLFFRCCFLHKLSFSLSFSISSSSSNECCHHRCHCHHHHQRKKER
mmetsp:Transcript_27138/g.30432  ORF Transcript_27138/g.30432 Transcript_27138/m.30432 type:complete len:204 (+) Transcript_27138:92-703(+)